MKDYIEQFYNEGLAVIFYIKPKKIIESHINNKYIVKFLTLIIKIIYTFLAIIFMIWVFIYKFPL